MASADQGVGQPAGPVVISSNGIVFGTDRGAIYGQGVTYRLEQATPTWKFTILHSFTGGADGGLPFPGVVLGPSGLLYGPTALGGAYGDGTIYALSKLPHKPEFNPFSIATPIGGYQEASLPVVSGSHLFYTTTFGGAYGTGAVYTAKLSASGVWHNALIYSLGLTGDADDPQPDSPLLIGLDGLLYGCAPGGPYGHGAVYRLTPPTSPGNAWTEVLLYGFASDGADPHTAGSCYITQDPTGFLLGVTSNGHNGNGTIFRLDSTPVPGAFWKETVLHGFSPTTVV